MKGAFSDTEIFGAVGIHLETGGLHRLKASSLPRADAHPLLETLKKQRATLRAFELHHFRLSSATSKSLLSTLSEELDRDLLTSHILMLEDSGGGMKKTLENTSDGYLVHDSMPKEVIFELGDLVDTAT